MITAGYCIVMIFGPTSKQIYVGNSHILTEKFKFETRIRLCMWSLTKVFLFWGGLLKTLAQTCRKNTRTLLFWERDYLTQLNLSYCLKEEEISYNLSLHTIVSCVLKTRHLLLRWFYGFFRYFQGKTSAYTNLIFWFC